MGSPPLAGGGRGTHAAPARGREAYAAADELKMIIHNQNDFKFAEEQAAKVGENCILFLQPEWSKRDQMMPEMVDYVLKNPRWKVSLQTHKYLNIP